MLLGFFILSALDLLSAGPDTFPVSQQAEIRAWILKCQHPHGGFCGSPNHRYPDGFYGDGEDMDPAYLPATYFAILNLGFVGGLEGVKKNECLEWLRRLQREDGSFGGLVTPDGKVEGGHDMRHCYVASAVRWMLRGDVPVGEEVDGDINVEGLVGHLRNGQVGQPLCVGGIEADGNRRTMEAFLRVHRMRHMVSVLLLYEANFLTILQLVTCIVP
jgi:geranylgeranyl transferase type-1 subunit beta